MAASAFGLEWVRLQVNAIPYTVVAVTLAAVNRRT